MNYVIGLSVRGVVSLGVVLTLFFIMQALIGKPPVIVEPVIHKIPVVVDKFEPTPEFKKEPRAEEVPPPQDQPITEFPKTINTDNIGTEILITGPVMDTPTITASAPASGSLVPILKVQPNYPSIALSRGYEGFCTVEYTVTPAGFTQNIRVVEGMCTHGAFKKPSIKAAEKFKYRAKQVDGLGVAVHGVRNRFTFNLD